MIWGFELNICNEIQKKEDLGATHLYADTMGNFVFVRRPLRFSKPTVLLIRTRDGVTIKDGNEIMNFLKKQSPCGGHSLRLKLITNLET